MALKKSVRSIGLLRLGNPWLVGKNVNRIVPVYALQNVLAPSFQKDANFQAAKNLTQNALYASTAFGDKISVSSAAHTDLEQTVFGILSPERRVFAKFAKDGEKLVKCAHGEGAPFPLTGGFVTATGSDDGLGKRVRELLESLSTDWNHRLTRLLLPSQPHDPVTAFAFALLAEPPGRKVDGTALAPNRALTGLSKSVADFVDALIIDAQSGDRISVIRNLAYGVYLGGVIRMVSGPVLSGRKKLPHVFAYAGLPPGDQSDPAVRLAITSYQDWISASWHETTKAIAEKIDRANIKKSGSAAENLAAKLRVALADQIPKAEELNTLISMLEPAIKTGAKHGTEKWLSTVLDVSPLDFPQHELSRRVRGLGTSIGLIGPDRGAGSARMLFDTPLLGVLVRGLVSSGRMPLDEFVSTVANRLGIVLGPGINDELVDKVSGNGNSGLDKFEILKINQDLLRERLLRVGLARSYSDSHTEVFADA